MFLHRVENNTFYKGTTKSYFIVKTFVLKRSEKLKKKESSQNVYSKNPKAIESINDWLLLV